MTLFRLNKGVTFRVLSNNRSSLCVGKTAEAYESILSEVFCASWCLDCNSRRTLELLVTLKFFLISETYTLVIADRLRFFPSSDWFVPTRYKSVSCLGGRNCDTMGRDRQLAEATHTIKCTVNEVL